MLDIFARYSDTIGLIGVVIILLSYYLLNVEKISSKSMSYLLANLIGSFLILFSLFFNWNLPSIIIELAWMLISLLGIYRVMKARG